MNSPLYNNMMRTESITVFCIFILFVVLVSEIYYRKKNIFITKNLKFNVYLYKVHEDQYLWCYGLNLKLNF